MNVNTDVQERTLGDTPTSTTAKGKRRWSAMDTVIVILAVACLGSLIFRLFSTYRAQRNQNEGQVYDVTFTVQRVHRDVMSGVTRFDSFYLCESGERLGYMGVYLDAEGNQQIALTMTPLSQDDDAAEGYVRAEGMMVCLGGGMQDGCVLVDGTDLYIAPGSELAVRTDRATFVLRLTSITARE